MSDRSTIIKLINRILTNSKRISELDEITTPTNNDLIEIVQNGVNYKIKKSNLVTGGGSGPAISEKYADIAAMLADQADQVEDELYIVLDASADATVDTGWAMYQKLSASTGVIANYRKLSEQESLDVTTTPDWNDTTAGKVERAVQSEAETAADATLGNRDNTRGLTARSFRWAFDAVWTYIKTQAQVFSSSLKAKHIAGDFGILTDTANIAWDANTIGNVGQVTLGGNRTLDAITNPLSGATYILRVVQDGTGSRTLAFNGAYTFPNGITPVLNAAAAAVTVFAFFYDGTNFRYIFPNGAYRFTDAYLENQKGTSGKKNPVHIDDTGKINKTTWVEHDTTNRKTTSTGIDNLMSTVLEEWKNSDGTMIMQILNGLRVKFGGTSAIWEIDDAVSSDNAVIKSNDNQAKSLKFTNKNGDELIVLRTTTGSLGVIFRQVVEYDFSQGFKKVHVQSFFITDTTAAAWNNIFALALAADQSITINVNHLHAYATDRSVAFAYGNMQGYARRDNTSTTDGTNPAFTISGDGITGVNWRIIANNTTDAVNIDFQNNSGTGKTWHVALDLTYILRSLPV